jgi:hypothetical protein
VCQEIEQVIIQETNNTIDETDQDDEKLFQEILDVVSSSYKNMVDIAALYFCGFSLDQGKLYEQIFIQLGKDMFSVIRLFAWYIPVMLKNPKLKTKEKLKKSFYIISTTVAFWYISSEHLFKKVKNSSLAPMRSFNLNLHDDNDRDEELPKPRNRPKIDT